MIGGFEYALAAGASRASADLVWHVSRVDDPLLLCGTPAGRPVVLQPVRPRRVHQLCLDRMFRDSQPPQLECGACPACGGQAPVVDGRIQSHGEWQMTGSGLVESGAACVGVNMRPGGRS